MLCRSFTLLVLFIPRLLVEASDFPNVKCTEEFGFYRDPQNCSNFYQCSFGKPAGFQFCPYELVFSNSIKNCVEKQSRYDDCNGGKFFYHYIQNISIHLGLGWRRGQWGHMARDNNFEGKSTLLNITYWARLVDHWWWLWFSLGAPYFWPCAKLN